MAKMIRMPADIRDPSHEQRWHYANFTDNFVFQYIIRHYPDILQEILGRIIPELRDEELTVIGHEVRQGESGLFRENVLDILIRAASRKRIVLDMQNTWEKCMCGRMRIYGSNVDSRLLVKGAEDYCIPEVIVICICKFDPLGRKQYVYDTAPERNAAESGWFSDGRRMILLNVKGRKGPVTPQLESFLKYVNGIDTDDLLCDTIDKAVEEMKKDEIVRRNYMTFSMHIEDERRDARKKGRREGRREGRQEGKAKKERSLILQNFREGIPAEQIAKFMHMPLEAVQRIIHEKSVMN
ncbi:MAG: Rpn family recombination-promoting nuclease/putative transposase [Solobacterium sp.]|nr:Rpn family recombination-promoting nuclease/putative transposase [Solobacterium sp.]